MLRRAKYCIVVLGFLQMWFCFSCAEIPPENIRGVSLGMTIQEAISILAEDTLSFTDILEPNANIRGVAIITKDKSTISLFIDKMMLPEIYDTLQHYREILDKEIIAIYLIDSSGTCDKLGDFHWTYDIFECKDLHETPFTQITNLTYRRIPWERHDIEHYSSQVYYIDSTTIVDGKMTYMYLDPHWSIDDSCFTYIIDYRIKSDSLFFNDEYCPITDTISFVYENRNIDLFLSTYDIGGSCDEECWVFWNKKDAVIARYYFQWIVLDLFIPEYWDSSIVDSLIPKIRSFEKSPPPESKFY